MFAILSELLVKGIGHLKILLQCPPKISL